MASWAIANGRVLIGSDLVKADILIEDGWIAAVGRPLPDSVPRWDMRGRLVLPGIVDLHGDAFERQIMPRPGGMFDTRLALMETDRHLVANGVTTAYHGLTVSWEPGLRGLDAAQGFMAALAAVKPRLASDTRLHLRHEVYNLDGEAQILRWIECGHVDLLAFNDHLAGIARDLDRPAKAGEYAARTGRTVEWIRSRIAELARQEPAIRGAVARLAAAARARGVPMASHDDPDPAHRRWMHALGVALSEFPLNGETAREARMQGAHVLLGAPNIVRGGSHCGRLDAAEAVRAGLCSALVSDYYYPALVPAVFALAGKGAAELGAAWPLIAANPAKAVGLRDRGVIEPAYRADLVIVEGGLPAYPRIAATVAMGEIVFLGEAPLAARLGLDEIPARRIAASQIVPA